MLMALRMRNRNNKKLRCDLEELPVIGLGIIFGALAAWIDYRCSRQTLRRRRPLRKKEAT